MGLKLAADCMVGRLTKWMRFLGFDTVFLPDGPWPPTADRTLLTRRTDQPHQRRIYGWDRVVTLTANDVPGQLDETVRALGLTRSDFQPMTRCGVCNLSLQTAEPRTVIDRAPLYVRIMQTNFLNCPGCGRVYWPGTHHERMMAVIDRLIP
ncbi:MAG: hypothetical protein HQK55_09840 [Deltaproteobacteria bacterium]|nr:hypothetical protein [Deltaproteobacteria bacterium]